MCYFHVFSKGQLHQAVSAYEFPLKCFETLTSTAGWPSGLRRWFKAPVTSCGVGSNPTPVKLLLSTIAMHILEKLDETSEFLVQILSRAFGLRPYHVEYTGSRPITEVKP